MAIPGNNPFHKAAGQPASEPYTPPVYSSKDVKAQMAPASAPAQDPNSYDSQFANPLPKEEQAKPGEIVDVDQHGNPVLAAERPVAPKAFHLVDNHVEKVMGLDKCPRCGSTDMVYSIEKVALICQSCRNEDHGVNVAERFNHSQGIANLDGRNITSGAQRIVSDEVQVTLKCQGCGAEVVIDTDKSLIGRCHWCRQQLSVNNQIPNGAVPDGLLPFRLTKEQAMAEVQAFVQKRRFFANKRFKAEFKAENVFGVYLPYMIADVKFTGGVSGRAEEHIRSYTRGSGNSKRTYYDYNEYELERELAVLADDISVEASSARQIEVASNTNNVINAVLPFPIEDSVEFRAHYLNGFNAERRDMDTEVLDNRLMEQMLTIVRAKADESAKKKFEKRGVRWEREHAKLIGSHQAAAYLPIWLYSFVEENAKNPRTKRRGQLIHYIAVNGVTGKTMGSIPISWGKLHLFSWLIGLIVGGPSAYLFMLAHGFPLWW